MQHRRVVFAMLCTVIALGFAASEATAVSSEYHLVGNIYIRTRLGRVVEVFELTANPSTGELAFGTATLLGFWCYDAIFIFSANGLSGTCSNEDGRVSYFGQYPRYPMGIAPGNMAFTLYDAPGLGPVSGMGAGFLHLHS